MRIPKLRKGSYYPSLLQPRRRTEKALLAVVQQAYVEGVSTRKVDDLLKALGLTGIDKSKVSRICKELDEVVEQFRNRPLEGEYPYLWLDALYLKVRQNHRIVSLAMVIAIGVDTQGRRHILGFGLGASEESAFWLDFLRSLVERGLNGVQLVISDAHEGLKVAISQVLTGATWQRCRVHFMRNVLAHVPKRDKALVAAAIHTIFAQPDREAARQQLAEVVKAMRNRWPKAAEILERAEDDILACSECHGILTTASHTETDEHFCPACQLHYPVIGGIPHFIQSHALTGLNKRFAQIYDWASWGYRLF